MTTNLASTRNLAPTTHLAGTFNVSTGSTNVVPTTSSQVNILFPGNTVTFSGITGTYVISSVTSSNITLTTNYAGTGSSTATATNVYGLANCNLWLRADLGVTSSSGSVSAWADQSGVGANFAQATGANQPTITTNAANGWPGIHFDGVNFFMSATWSSAIVKTIVIVWLDGGTQVNLASAFSTGTNAPGVTCDTLTWTGDGSGGGTAAHAAAVNVKLTQSNYNVTAFTYDQTGTTYGTRSYFNGIGITNFLSGTSGSGTTLSAPGATATLGERNDGVSTHRANCTILEIATYSTELTPGQIKSVSNYMAARYGIQVDNDIVQNSGGRYSSIKQNNLPSSTPTAGIITLPGTFSFTNGGTLLTGTFAVTSTTTLSGTFNVTNGTNSVTTSADQTSALVAGSVVQFGSQNGNLSGTFTVTNGSPTVTASTSQTGVVIVGSIIQFGAVTTAIYVVSAINGAGTTITLVGNYQGTSSTTSTASLYYSVTSVTFPGPTGTITLSANYTGTTNTATTAVNEPTFVATSTSQVGLLGSGATIFFSPNTTTSQTPANSTVSTANVSSSYLVLVAAYTGTNSAAADGYALSAIATSAQSFTIQQGLIGFTLPGTFSVINGSATVNTTANLTGVLNANGVNNVIIFSSNPYSPVNCSAAYQVSSVSSTSITLTANYTGTTNTTATAFPTGLNLPGTFAPNNGNSRVNSSSTILATYITAGDSIIFGGGTASGIYIVLSVDTGGVTLTTPYAGTSAAAATAVYAQPNMPLITTIGNMNSNTTVYLSGNYLHGTYGFPTMSGLDGYIFGVSGNWPMGGAGINTAIFANAGIAPDGTNTASIFQIGACSASQSRLLTSPNGLPATFDNKVYTISMYAKPGRIEASSVTTQYFYYRWEPGTAGSQLIWDLLSGQVFPGGGDSINPSHVGSGQYYIGNGWWRMWASFLYNAGAGLFGLGTGGNSGGIQYTSDGTGYIYVWGAQVIPGFNPGQFTQTGSNLLGTFTVTNGSNIVPTTVNQVGAVAANNSIQFGSQLGVNYTISAVSSTQITLTGNYTGTTSFTTCFNNATQVVNHQGLSNRVLASNRSIASRHNISLSGTFGVTNGNNSVSTTADQTSVVVPGNTIVFGSPKNSGYIVSTVTSTTITLVSNYTGVTNTKTNAIVLVK